MKITELEIFHSCNLIHLQYSTLHEDHVIDAALLQCNLFVSTWMLTDIPLDPHSFFVILLS